MQLSVGKIAAQGGRSLGRDARLGYRYTIPVHNTRLSSKVPGAKRQDATVQ